MDGIRVSTRSIGTVIGTLPPWKGFSSGESIYRAALPTPPALIDTIRGTRTARGGRGNGWGPGELGDPRPGP
jgi:hypothetical protein